MILGVSQYVPLSRFFYDAYKKNRQTGSLIIIDEQTNETIGAGMIILLMKQLLNTAITAALEAGKAILEILLLWRF